MKRTCEEIRALMEEAEGKPVGHVWSHAELAGIMGLRARSNRYYRLIGRFRRRLKQERNVWLKTDMGEGYRVADPSERMTCAVSKHKAGDRQIRDAIDLAVTTDEKGLSESQIRYKDHCRNLEANMLASKYLPTPSVLAIK